MILGFLALGLVLLTAVVPTYRCMKYLDQARAKLNIPLQGPHADHPAWQLLQSAAAADTWDPTPHRAQAEWVSAGASKAPKETSLNLLEATTDALDRAIRRDPSSIHLWRLQFDAMWAYAKVARSDVSLIDTFSCGYGIQRLYPSSPRDLLRIGEKYLEAAANPPLGGDWEIGALGLAESAGSFLESAISLDDQRLPWEEFHRFTEAEKKAIREKIERARASVGP